MTSQVFETARQLEQEIADFCLGKEGEVFDQLRGFVFSSSPKLTSIVENCPPPQSWVPYKKQFLLTPGNGSLSTIESICYQLLTQPSELLVIPSRRDKIGRAFLEHLCEANRRSWPLTYFVQGDLEPLTEFGERQAKLDEVKYFNPDFAVLYGSDRTIREYEKQLSLHCRVVKYGTKTSIGVHVLDDEIPLEKYAERYARDFFIYNGVGCLNTSVLYLLSDKVRRFEEFIPFARALATGRKKYIPEPSWNTRTTLEVNLIKADIEFYQEQGVFLRDTTDCDGAIGLGNGTAVLVPCTESDVMWEWRQREHYLSSATIYSKSNGAFERLKDKLFDLGVSRTTCPGNAQNPSDRWRHDGMPIIPVWGREVWAE